LARANTGHADRLPARLRDAPLSTRELRCWFDHYRQASRAVRERMVEKKPLVDALLDRLQNHCVIIRINGPSLRNPELEATSSNSTAPARPPRRIAANRPASPVE
jgi:hypothetical protein